MGERMSAARRVGYALGGAGYMIPDRIVVTVAVYYFLPPAGRGLLPQLPETIFLGVLTAWGVARLVGGLFDSLADPIVGFASDRSQSRLGRRRSFLIAGVLPMVALPALLFWPPADPGSRVNAVALAVLLALFYVAFTVYVAPYLALLPELARDTKERVDLSTLLAVVTLPAVLLFQPLWLFGLDWGQSQGFSAEQSIRGVVVASSVVALLLCIAPIVAVDERRFARPEPSALALGPALMRTLRCRPFVIYLVAQICFILGVTMLQPAAPYYAVVVLGRDEGFAGWLSAASAPPALLGFLMVRVASPRFGPKRTVMACVALLGLATALLGAMRADVPGGPHDGANLALAFAAMGIAGLAMAGFVVLPHVLMGQVIDLDESETGANRSAMFYGVQGLATKWVYQVSLALMSFLLVRFGNSPAQPWGVIAIGPVAAMLCGVSLFAWALYPEGALLKAAAAREAGPEVEA